MSKTHLLKSGPIATVDVFEDNVLVREAFETVPAGTVLVVDGKGSRNCALLGDRLAKMLVSAGLPDDYSRIHSRFRRNRQYATWGDGDWHLPGEKQKRRKGKTDVALEFGGVRWEPGAYVYADQDGIVLAKTDLLKKSG